MSDLYPYNSMNISPFIRFLSRYTYSGIVDLSFRSSFLIRKRTIMY